MVPVRMTVNASLMGQHFTIQKTAQLSCLATMCLPIGLRSGEQKLFPIIVAKNTWRELLYGRALLWFIDNYSSLAAVIRSYSPVLENYEMLVINARMDVELQALHVYSRVPSKSNLSDDPSRLQFSELEAKGFKRCSPFYDLTRR